MHGDEELRQRAERWRLRQRAERWRRVPRSRPAEIPRPGAGQESVWDYPRPPRVEPVARRVRVLLGDLCLADTTAALRVVETASPACYYVPPDSVQTSLLTPEPETTLCEWKGLAHYWSARAGPRRVPNVAWSYPEPFEEYEALAGYFAFFPGRVDACYVGDERVTPQPGDYYEGWITRDVVGPFKGEPGSDSW